MVITRQHAVATVKRSGQFEAAVVKIRHGIEDTGQTAPNAICWAPPFPVNIALKLICMQR